jgi:RNA polymerase sigma factor (sigma-70 family)
MATRRNATPTLHHYLRRIATTRPGDRHATGDPRSADRLAVENLGLVLAIARRYWFDGTSLDDLVQAGNVGLLRAVRSFDPERGGRFATWLSFGIRQAILDHLAVDQHPVALPRGVHLRYVRTGSVTIGRTGRRAGTPVRLERVAVDEAADDPDRPGPGRRADRLPHQEDEAPTAVEAAILGHEVRRLLDVLDDNNRELIVERFGLDGRAPRGTVAQAADRGLSREAVRLRYVAAMGRLAGEARRRRLDLWLDD